MDNLQIIFNALSEVECMLYYESQKTPEISGVHAEIKKQLLEYHTITGKSNFTAEG